MAIEQTSDGAGISDRTLRTMEDPPIARALLGDVRWGWLWAILRLYLGWEWLHAGWEKLYAPAGTANKAGAAITGFVSKALTKTGGEHPDVQGWYVWFLQNVVQPYPVAWSYLVVWGEIQVGIALILGLFTGVAVFFGSFMNANYLLVRTVSVNPILFFVIATWFVLAWKTAGWWGLDRWVLPLLGTPWRPGRVSTNGGRRWPSEGVSGPEAALR